MMDNETIRPPAAAPAPPNVELLGAPTALERLKADVRQSYTIHCWTYLLERTFFDEVFSDFLKRGRLYMITDHRMRYVAAGLQDTHERFTARSWSYNRTMHEKTFVFPDLNAVTLGSHNLTRGSYTLSNNRTARVQSTQLTKALCDAWHADWTRAKPMPRLKSW